MPEDAECRLHARRIAAAESPPYRGETPDNPKEFCELQAAEH